MAKKVNMMTNVEAAEAAMVSAVAQRIATLRKDQKLTFDALAQKSGVSKGTLVQIEQKSANPSIATLCRLATALGVSVADLVAHTEPTPKPVSLVPASEQRQLWRGPNDGSATLLAGTNGPDMLELWNWELKPGERFTANAHTKATREIIHVTAGKLVLEVDGKSTIVPSGATAIAQTDLPHAYANPGKATVKFIMTVHEPASDL